MKKALFGISLDNPLYSTARMRAGLIEGLREFDEVVFLIADSLQIYNHVSKNVGDSMAMSSIDWSAPHSQYFAERTIWLNKIRTRLPEWPDDQKWTIAGVNSVADKKAFQIQRSVRILYAVDATFRSDVIDNAKKFAERGLDSKTFESRVSLSILYILEEIALNVKLRVQYGIEDEFYLGDTFEIFRNVYAGKYMKNHDELFGRKSRSRKLFRFHSWDTSEENWRLEVGMVQSAMDASKIVDFRRM